MITTQDLLREIYKIENDPRFLLKKPDERLFNNFSFIAELHSSYCITIDGEMIFKDDGKDPNDYANEQLLKQINWTIENGYTTEGYGGRRFAVYKFDETSVSYNYVKLLKQFLEQGSSLDYTTHRLFQTVVNRICKILINDIREIKREQKTIYTDYRDNWLGKSRNVENELISVKNTLCGPPKDELTEIENKHSIKNNTDWREKMRRRGIPPRKPLCNCINHSPTSICHLNKPKYDETKDLEREDEEAWNASFPSP